jgi:hypothetical protein
MASWSGIAKSDETDLIQIKVADRPARVGRFLCLPNRFLELLFQQVRGVLLCFHRLPENRIPPAVLLFHGPRRLIQIIEHLRLQGSHVRNDGPVAGVHLQRRSAARAGYFEARFLCHSW